MIRTDNPEDTVRILNGIGIEKVETAADGSLRVDEQLDNTPDMVRAIVNAGISLREICLNSISLEDYYLNVTGGGEHNG